MAQGDDGILEAAAGRAGEEKKSSWMKFNVLFHHYANYTFMEQGQALLEGSSENFMMMNFDFQLEIASEMCNVS